MAEIVQNIIALSLQIGVLIGIVLLLGHFVKKPYIAVGRYFLWLVLALRLLFPINLGWVHIEGLRQSMEISKVSEYGKEDPISEKMQQKGNIYNKEKTVQEIPIKDDVLNGQFAKETEERKQVYESEKKSARLTGRQQPEKSGFMSHIKSWYQVHGDGIWTIICTFWLIGIAGMVGYEVIMYQSVYKSIRRWRRPAPKEYRQQFESVCREMGIEKRIPVYQCSKVASPMIVGLYRPYIVLPERKYQKKSLYYIYKHELTHFRHGDLYYKLIQTMVRCIYWFHPLVHAMYQQAAFDVELVCDEKVTRNQSKTFCREYSFVLLDTLTTQNQKTFPLSTCFFNGGREQMKERFRRIMGQNKKKYGLGLFGLLIVCAVILGNISLHPQKDADVSKIQAGTSSSQKNETQLSDKTLTKTKNILVVGQENIADGKSTRADLTLLVTLDPQKKKCYVTEIARDLAITCKDEYLKVSQAYGKYGIDTFKKAMEKETGIAIDSTIEVNFQQFENVIDSVDGIQIKLSKKEAHYLNSTNYIREEKYRNVKEGTQLLNGQQVLGYARIRKVESSNGQRDTFGRGERALTIVSAMLQRIKEMDSKNWVNMASEMYNMVSASQLDMDTVYQIMQAVLVDGYTFETQQIPEADAFIAKRRDDMGSYLFYDFSSSKTLQKLKSIKVISENEDGQEVVLSAGKLDETQDDIEEINVANEAKEDLAGTEIKDEIEEEEPEEPRLVPGENVSME